jgi:hypothetical protein
MFNAYIDTAYIAQTAEVIAAAVAFILICCRSSHASVKKFRHSSFLFIVSSGLLAVYYYGYFAWYDSGIWMWFGQSLYQFGMAGVVIRIAKISEEVRELDTNDRRFE